MKKFTMLMQLLAAILVWVPVVMIACSSADQDVLIPEEVSQTEQAVTCPVDVQCPYVGSFSFAVDTISGVRCYYSNHAPVDVSNQGCPDCCPKWSQCVPNGCGTPQYFQTLWTCRAVGGC